MSKFKKEVIKIVFTIEDEVKRAKRSSRAVLGVVPCTKVHKTKKGGAYSRKTKHKNRVVDKTALLLLVLLMLRLR